MPLDRSKLWEYLNKKTILLDEKMMWYRLGFYVYPESTTKDSNNTPKTYMVDAAGNLTIIGTAVATNLRMTSIEWWESEKKKPRSSEVKKTQDVETGPLDELENRNGT